MASHCEAIKLCVLKGRESITKYMKSQKIARAAHDGASL